MRRLLVITGLILSFAVGTVLTAPAVDPLNLPSPYDLVMLAGADYLLSIQIKNSAGASTDLTVNTYSAQFRAAPAPAGQLFANLSTITRVPTFTRYSSNGEAVVTTYLPYLDIKLSKAQTRALSGKSGLWDLRQTGPTGLVSYPMAGKIVIRPTVTQ